jgi:Ca2+-binding EF-hand superfamily protein
MSYYLSPSQIHSLKSIFDSISCGSENVSIDQFLSLCAASAIPHLTHWRVNDIVTKNNQVNINFDLFCHLYSLDYSSANQVQSCSSQGINSSELEEITANLSEIMKNNTITAEELKQLFDSIGDDYSLTEITEMIAEISLTHSTNRLTVHEILNSLAPS